MTDEVRSTIQKRDDKGRIRHGGEWLTIWADPNSVKSQAEINEDHLASELCSQIKRSLTATARSVAGQPGLTVRFEGSAARMDGTTAVLPDVPVNIPQARLSAICGEADALSCFLRFHDAEIHRKLRPSKPHPSAMFDKCERSRCEILGVRLMPGIWPHLVDAHQARLDSLGLLYAHIAAQIPVVEALPAILRDFLIGSEHLSINSGAMEMWDRFVRSRLRSNLSDLRPVLSDQKKYGERALKLIDGIYDALEYRKDELTRSGAQSKMGENTPNGAMTPPGVPAQTEAPPVQPNRAEGTEQIDEEGAMAQMMQLSSDHCEPTDELLTAERKPEQPYRVFSQHYDQVKLPTDILSADRLVEHRQTIDQTLVEQKKYLVRLANRLSRRLLAKQQRNWLFDLEEGLLDTARLDRVVVNPGSALSFKVETDTEFRDTVVALLIDNSGSMRGAPIMTAALTAEMVSGALERAGVKSEVLGYTTVDWNGGKSTKAWIKEGKPKDPGRLSDLLHIVYKSADVPLRRERNNIALMLEPALLKENIDGEALEWAERRLLSRQEQRKILIVISDGAPVDSTTLKNNSDADLLDRHLRQVIKRIECDTQIELVGIGLKHDVTDYYQHSFVIENHSELGQTLITELDRLFVGD